MEELHKIAEHYGQEAQTRQLVEECGELITVVLKAWHDKDGGRYCLAEEIADIEICLEQVKYLYGIKRQTEKLKEFKIKRQIERILNE